MAMFGQFSTGPHCPSAAGMSAGPAGAADAAIGVIAPVAETPTIVVMASAAAVRRIRLFFMLCP